ncbi:MAG: dihydromonapterin reductase [Oceanospirillaceae bacterium]|nr:dihydromonapterin reductase [Oceanospirillaceae bacterium]
MSIEQTILITGGAQRVGLHCAQRFAEAGYRVIITCRAPRAEWEHTPLQGIEVMLADFSTQAGIESFIERLDRRQVRLRALIHNASVWLDDSTGADAFQQMFMVHLQAPYLINLASERWFDQEGPADIIHMTDFIARQGSPRHIAYSATKAALENLTLSFASRFAPSVKVNSIAPALIMFNEGDSPEYRKKALSKSALGIVPGPDVVFQAVNYLMNNPYVTGTTLDLNGGRHLKR